MTLFVPVLNEIEGMKAIMPRVRTEWADEVLVVDGGSSDGSAEFARKRGYRVIGQKLPGISGAYAAALEAAAGEVIVSFSPDGNSLPELIPELVSKIREGNDLVIASRYLKGAGSEDDDLLTAFGNRLFTFLINVIFGARYTDSLVMLRAFRKSMLEGSPRDIPPRAGYEPLLSIWCAKKKFRAAEIPGDEPRRIGGVRKMNCLKNGLDILKLIFMLLKQ